MLNRIPILDHAPDESYEATPQLGWFVTKPAAPITPEDEPSRVLYQLWQRTVFSEITTPDQVWVKVETFNRQNDD